MAKIKKGDYGYIRSQKLTRFVKTILVFLLPIGIFILGLVLNNGSRKNIYTVIAMVGCIPACLMLVSAITMLLRKPMSQALYEEVSQRSGDLLMAYELYVTTQTDSLFLDCTAFCGEYIAAYADQKVKAEVLRYMEDHIVKVFRTENYKINVKIFDQSQKKAFLERLDSMNAKKEDYEAQAAKTFVPYVTYPDLTRTEIDKHLLMAVSL